MKNHLLFDLYTKINAPVNYIGRFVKDNILINRGVYQSKMTKKRTQRILRRSCGI